MRRLIGFCVLAALLLLAGVGLLRSSDRSVPESGSSKQEAELVPNVEPLFWTDPVATMRVLMNTPGSHDVSRPDMPEASKQVESHGFASDTEVISDSRPRLIFLGDEMTYGLLPNDLTLSSQVEQQLDGNWQVINAGRPDESSYTSLLRLKHVLSPSSSDVIVVVWPIANDLRELRATGVYAGPHLERTGPNDWKLKWEDGESLPAVTAADTARYLDQFQSYLAMQRRAHDQPAPVVENKALYARTSVGLAHRLLRFEEGAAYEHMQQFRDAIARTLSICRAFREMSEARVVFLLLPPPMEVDPPRTREAHGFEALTQQLGLELRDLRIALDIRDWQKRFLSEEGMEVLDPAPTMRSAAHSKQLYDDHDWTLNAEGYRVLAEQVAMFITTTSESSD